jgi:hypothetical protein
MKRTQVFLTSLLICFCMIAFGQTAKQTVKKVAAPAKKADNTLTAKEKKEGYVLLFDGKTMDKWHGYNKTGFPSKGWETTGGVLHCIGSGMGEAGSGGDIVTNDKYKDFELSLDWKISEGGNSGIFILAQEKANQPIYYSSPEMQLLDNDRHPDSKLGKDGNRKAGSLYDLIPAKPQNTKPAGEWNSIRITCYQGSVIYHQNGADVVEYHLWTDEWKKMVAGSKFKDWADFTNVAHEGLIGLQDHGGDIWFKNIKIKKL